MPLTAERLGELTATHKQVGHDVTFVRDAEAYGKRDHWAAARVAGDCEDFGLAYRARLVERYDWPAGALRLALCETETGERHVVLSAETTGGTWILDNRLGAPVLWFRPAYRWLARERPGRFLWERIPAPGGSRPSQPKRLLRRSRPGGQVG